MSHNSPPNNNNINSKLSFISKNEDNISQSIVKYGSRSQVDQLSPFLPLRSDKHISSIEKIGRVFEEMHLERLELTTSLNNLYQLRIKAVEEMRDVDEALRELTSKKVKLESTIHSLSQQEFLLKHNLELLDKKIESIGEESVKFESSIKSIHTSPLSFSSPSLMASGGGSHQHQHHLQHGGVGGSELFHYQVPLSAIIPAISVYENHEEISSLSSSSSPHHPPAAAITSLSVSSVYGVLVTGANDNKIRVYDLASTSTTTTGTGTGTGTGNHHYPSPTSLLRSFVVNNSDGGIVKCVGYKEGVIISGHSDASLRVWYLSPPAFTSPPSSSSTHSPKSPSSSSSSSSSHSRHHHLNVHEESHNNHNQHNNNNGGGGGNNGGMNHRLAINCLQFDDHKVITGSDDMTIKIWDINYLCSSDHPPPSAVINTLQGHSAAINTLQFYEYGLISGGSDGMIKMWDLRSGKSHRQIKHSSPISSLQFDDYVIISGGGDVVNIWDLRTSKCIKTLPIFSQVHSLCFNSSYLVVGSADPAIRVYSRSEYSPMKSLVGHNKAVRALQLVEDFVFSASDDSSVRTFPLPTPQHFSHSSPTVSQIPQIPHYLTASFMNQNY